MVEKLEAGGAPGEGFAEAKVLVLEAIETTAVIVEVTAENRMLIAFLYP